jgi:hypothetical protein
MSRKKAIALLVHNSENLDQPPHMLPALIDLVSGEGHPTSYEREQLLAHLAGCTSCQDALRTLLAVELGQDRQVGITGEPVSKLISWLSDITEKTQMRNDIPAYIEAIELWGNKEAKKRYPRLTEHLQKCKSCQSLVEGIQTLKREAEQAGKIAPLLADTGE